MRFCYVASDVPGAVITPESVSIVGQDPQMPLSQAPGPWKMLSKKDKGTEIDYWTCIGQLGRGWKRPHVCVENVFCFQCDLQVTCWTKIKVFTDRPTRLPESTSKVQQVPIVVCGAWKP